MCVVCVRGGFWGGKNGSCQRVARAIGKLPPSFLPSLDWEQHPRFGWRLWEKTSDAAKRYPERRRTSNCNAAHFSTLIELCWREGRGLKLFLGAFFTLLSFLTVTACLLASSAQFPLSFFTFAGDGNWFLAVCNDLMCLLGVFGVRQRQKQLSLHVHRKFTRKLFAYSFSQYWWLNKSNI